MRSVPSLVAATLLLGGCAAGPNCRPPAPAALGVPEAWSVPAAASREDLNRWWTSFGDPVLSQLMDRASADNLDLAQAEARVRQAREALVASRAQLLPTVSGSAGAGRNEVLRGGGANAGSGSFSNSATSLSLGLDAGYQADVFGGVRRSVEASRADWQSSGYAYAATLLSVQSELARNYVLARAYQAQLDLSRQSLAIQDDNLEIAGFRVQAGLVSSLDLEQARASRAQTAASIPAYEQQYNAAVSRLGILTGQAPGALKPLLAARAPIPTGPQTIGAGVPADSLRRRPDVLSSERALAAATARIGVAKARLYPALSITGSLATSATGLSGLLDTITGNLFGQLAQTIFDGGALRAQTRGAQAQADAAFAAYKASVLTALEDTENAVVALDASRAREGDFGIAADAASASAILARSQYRAGLTDFTTLNTQEAALLSARTSLIQAHADKAQALIALFVALGGGWETALPASVAPAAPIPAASTTVP